MGLENQTNANVKMGKHEVKEEPRVVGMTSETCDGWGERRSGCLWSKLVAKSDDSGLLAWEAGGIAESRSW